MSDEIKEKVGPPATCIDCVFYAEGEVSPDLQKHGECRRFPPSVHAIPAQTPQGMGVQFMTGYPKVSDHFAACGEFELSGEPGDFEPDT